MKYEFNEAAVKNLAVKAKGQVEQQVTSSGKELNADVAVKYFKANGVTEEQAVAVTKVALVVTAEKYDLSKALELVANAAVVEFRKAALMPLPYMQDRCPCCGRGRDL